MTYQDGRRTGNNPTLTAIGVLLVLIGLVGAHLFQVFSVVWTDEPTDPEPKVIEEPQTDETDVSFEEYNLDVNPPTLSDAPLDADDGELHDGRTVEVSYTIGDERWEKVGTEHVDAYGRDVELDFDVHYPQLVGDLEHLDEINELLERAAMSTVRTYYENPSEETVQSIERMLESSESETIHALLISQVNYAISYNSEDLLSVCFSDSCFVGSIGAETIQLRTVNINLRTGEAYTQDDVLTVDEATASSLVDGIVQAMGSDSDGDGVIADDECRIVSIAGREALVEALQGKGELAEAGRVYTCLFIDGNGRPNLGINWWLSDESGRMSRGWWDVTITDEQLAAARKDSTLWDVLG